MEHVTPSHLTAAGIAAGDGGSSGVGRGGIGSLGKWDPEPPDLGWGNGHGAAGQGGRWSKGSRRPKTIKHTKSDGSLAANALS